MAPEMALSQAVLGKWDTNDNLPVIIHWHSTTKTTKQMQSLTLGYCSSALVTKTLSISLHTESLRVQETPWTTPAHREIRQKPCQRQKRPRMQTLRGILHINHSQPI